MRCTTCGAELHGTYCSTCGTFSGQPDGVGSGPAPRTELSGWWRRVGATIVDNLLLVIPTTIVAVVVAQFAGTTIGELAGVAAQGVYMVELLASPRGQTIGNRVVGTRVRDELTGAALSRAQALRRWGFIAVYSLLEVFSQSSSSTTSTHALGAVGGLAVVMSLVGLADCLFPLFNTRKQTLHDRFAHTLVERV
ncbi:MAG: RDD family protein [Acidimicrobiales bacterium]